MNKLIVWFDHLTLREKMIVGIGVPLAMMVLTFFFIIEPLQKYRYKVDQRVQTAHDQLVEMAELGKTVSLLDRTDDINTIFGDYLGQGQGAKIFSIPLLEDDAKKLFLKLAQHGDTTIMRSSDGRWVVWFEN